MGRGYKNMKYSIYFLIFDIKYAFLFCVKVQQFLFPFHHLHVSECNCGEKDTDIIVKMH
jgi:hypothetical protein